MASASSGSIRVTKLSREPWWTDPFELRRRICIRLVSLLLDGPELEYCQTYNVLTFHPRIRKSELLRGQSWIGFLGPRMSVASCLAEHKAWKKHQTLEHLELLPLRQAFIRAHASKKRWIFHSPSALSSGIEDPQYFAQRLAWEPLSGWGAKELS